MTSPATKRSGRGGPGKSRPAARGPNLNKQKPRPWFRKSSNGQPRDQKITLTHTQDFSERLNTYRVPDESSRDLLEGISEIGLQMFEALDQATKRKKTVDSIAAAIAEQVPLLHPTAAQQLAQRIYKSRQSSD